MPLHFWGTPSLKVPTAHLKTYKRQRKEGLETLDTQVKGSHEGLGDFVEEGSVEQVWESKAELGWGERKEVKMTHAVLEVGKNKTYAAVVVSALSLAVSVSMALCSYPCGSCRCVCGFAGAVGWQ